MIHFPVLRTRRLTIQLRELTLGEALAIASIPSDQDQAATTAMLRACVQRSSRNSIRLIGRCKSA